MAADWFEALTGFTERSYEETQRSLAVDGRTLRSSVNGRSYVIGELETPTLGELRQRALDTAMDGGGAFTVSNVSGDVGRMHQDAANRNALFQVASQFNLLEMTGSGRIPEDGVTDYADDHTQGPACAIAAGAATIYRNYFMPVDGQTGQTRHRQLDCLRDVGEALGNTDGSLWTMTNGYALCTESGLDSVRRTLGDMDEAGTGALRDRLRIGVHWEVEVTAGGRTDVHVTQAFCSALPVSYTRVPSPRWEPFARLVLEGAYEATLWAAALNARRSGSNVVFLTHLGGGAFGNERPWIIDATRRALSRVRKAGVGLDVRIVSYGAPATESVQLVHEFR